MKSIKLLGAMLVTAAISAPAFAKPSQPAPTWTDETSSISVSGGLGHITLGGDAFTFTDPPAVQLAYYNDNPGNNSAPAIASFIDASGLFGLTPATSLTLAKSNDSYGGGAITSTTPFNYLAVHVGRGELLFHWTNAVSSFTLNGTSLSNYRAFTTAVPEPETYAMMIAGLGLVGFMARRRKQK